MYHAHHHRRRARPAIAFPRPINHPAMRANPTQPGGAGIALADGVGRDQAERAMGSQQIEGPPEEMRHQIGVAVGFGMDDLQPIQITRPVAVDQRVLAGKGGVADEGVEAGRVPLEHLGKLDFPMEGMHRPRAGEQRRLGRVDFGRQAGGHGFVW